MIAIDSSSCETSFHKAFLAHLLKSLHSLRFQQFTMSSFQVCLVEGLVFCKKCGFKLEPKNTTSDPKKKIYRRYKCKSCSKAVDIDDLHALIVEDMKKHWGHHLMNLDKTMMVTLSKLKKELTEQVSGITRYLESKQYEKSLPLPHEPSYSDLVRNFEIVQRLEQEKLQRLRNTVESIENLAEQNSANEVAQFQPQEFWCLSTVELRAFYLRNIRKILIDLDRGNVTIQYRNVPFPGKDLLFGK